MPSSLSKYDFKDKPKNIGNFHDFYYNSYKGSTEMYINLEGDKEQALSLTTTSMAEILDKMSQKLVTQHLISTYTRDDKFNVKYGMIDGPKDKVLIVHKQFEEDSYEKLVIDVGISLKIDQVWLTVRYSRNHRERDFEGEAPKYNF